jgi:transposase
MERTPLEQMLARGMSLEAIGREVGRHPSTVAYWLRRHELVAVNAQRFARRGPPSRAQLEQLAAAGATLREMAEAADRSIATVRHWLRAWEIERARVPSPRRPADPSTAPRTAVLECAKHGTTAFRLDSRGSYRCCLCRQEAVASRRRRIKQILVEEAGGACAICGYDRSLAALQFHHVDPSTKRFALSQEGVTRSLDRARAEAAKCVLLCANCHTEVEAGHVRCPAADGDPRTPRGGFEPPRTD